MCFSISCVFSYNCIKLIVFWVDILVYFHRIFVFFFFFFLGYLLCKDWFNLSWKSLIQQSIFNEGSGPTSRKFRIAAWCMQLEVASRTNVNGCLKVAVVAVMFILFIFLAESHLPCQQHHFACCITVAMPVELSALCSMPLSCISRIVNIFKGQIFKVC